MLTVLDAHSMYSAMWRVPWFDILLTCNTDLTTPHVCEINTVKSVGSQMRYLLTSCASVEHNAMQHRYQRSYCTKVDVRRTTNIG